MDESYCLEYILNLMPLYPNDSGMLAQLATAYMSLEDVENAKVIAEKAVVIRPDDIYAWAVLKKIQAFKM